jgi:SAM-dependent methyltransferase
MVENMDSYKKKSTNIEKYLKQLKLEQLFKELGATKPKILAETVEHFTTKEAKQRDKIVVGYFGQQGIDRITNTVARIMLEPPKLSAKAKVLDVGAGTGFFTERIITKINARLPSVNFYAMDLTPAMLLALAKKKMKITPFIGMAENIKGSVKEARKYTIIPYKFDAIFSTLMLHHSVSPEKVFNSFKAALKKRGKAIVVDLCKHEFVEFKTEMGDIHLGFEPEDVYKMARKYFSDLKVEKMHRISCACSGRSAEIFVAVMHNCS